MMHKKLDKNNNAIKEYIHNYEKPILHSNMYIMCMSLIT